jgi:hypothetical protein
VASDRDGDSNVSGSSQWTNDEVCGKCLDLREWASLPKGSHMNRLTEQNEHACACPGLRSFLVLLPWLIFTVL